MTCYVESTVECHLCTVRLTSMFRCIYEESFDLRSQHPARNNSVDRNTAAFTETKHSSQVYAYRTGWNRRLFHIVILYKLWSTAAAWHYRAAINVMTFTQQQSSPCDVLDEIKCDLFIFFVLCDWRWPQCNCWSMLMWLLTATMRTQTGLGMVVGDATHLC